MRQIPTLTPKGPETTFWGECEIGDEVGPNGIHVFYNLFHMHLQAPPWLR